MKRAERENGRRKARAKGERRRRRARHVKRAEHEDGGRKQEEKGICKWLALLSMRSIGTCK